MATYRKIADRLTFGVEIECTLPHAGPAAQFLRVGGRHSGIPCDRLPGQVAGKNWKCESDGSIMAGHGRYGVEFVSPVLSGVAGLQNLAATMATIRSWGARTNASCGFHVHVGWTSNSIADLRKVVAYTAQYEDAFYAAAGTRSRETGRMCKSIKGFERLPWNQGRIEDARYGPGKQLRLRGCEDRYMLLNLENLLMGNGKPTVEFRVFSGTVKTLKAITFVRLALAAFENALNYPRTPKWNVKARGTGAEAMAKLLWSLGWGRVASTGNADSWNASELEGEGLPTIAASMQELTRLAAKYDGVTSPADEVEADTLPEPTTAREARRVAAGEFGTQANADNLPPANPTAPAASQDDQVVLAMRELMGAEAEVRS